MSLFYTFLKYSYYILIFPGWKHVNLVEAFTGFNDKINYFLIYRIQFLFLEVVSWKQDKSTWISHMAG